MSRKSKRKILLGLMNLVICVAAIFSVKSFLYADAGNGISKKENADKISALCESITALPDVVGTTKRQGEDEVQEQDIKGTIESMDLDSEDSYLLAKIAMAEAEGEDIEGKALVMLVVLNRVRSDEFPDSIKEVIFQECQFSPINNGRYDMVEPDSGCYKALELIQIERWDESQGALYFESKSESDWHRKHLEFLFQHGNHFFYKNKE